MTPISIKEAAQGGLMEVQLGKLAQEKAANEKVKQFGKRMEQDHIRSDLGSRPFILYTLPAAFSVMKTEAEPTAEKRAMCSS